MAKYDEKKQLEKDLECILVAYHQEDYIIWYMK